MSENIITEERIGLLISQGRYEMAIKYTKDKLSQEPENTECLRMLCLCYINTGDHKAALKIGESLLRAEPDEPYNHYLTGMSYHLLDKEEKALEHAKLAIGIIPFEAAYYALASDICLSQKDYEKALEYADTGLRYDAENTECLNMRTRALLKLKKGGEAFETLDTALEKNPENALTHANYGWTLLEKGQPEKALNHFKEALRLDPEQAWAKSGMLEALKARYMVYKLFLKYSFWIANMSRGQRIAMFVGLWLSIRMIRGLSESTNGLEAIGYLAVGLYLVFILSTWVVGQLFNAALLFNPYGKYLVEGREKLSALITTACVSIAVVGGAALLLSGTDLFIPFFIVFIGASLGIGNMFDIDAPRKRLIGIVLSVSLFLAGLAGLLMLATGNEAGHTLVLGFMFLTIGYTWVRSLMLT